MVIRILDHVEHASSYEDGDAIFKLISAPISRGEDVVVSFDGIQAVPSAFINASLVRLAELTTVGEIRAHLKIAQSTRQINDLIRSRFDFLANMAS
ncbi:STAS-like domain-containing protein [Acidovorax sp. ACV02]|uniref:STAS-like domain-containing protein n=1 Tax=Acidovorax sp. ACV02 TaxID=2769310 RepID=UPI00177B3A21|nr:DUF4325 domain-containing protein [Acidovorax sp. ACV02]MBD9406298.1 STAS-like domain-containing protein [Acidovorax sp. ACV02]